MKTIVFDPDVKDFILDLFDKEEDTEGYIIERESGSRVITPNGSHIRKDEFAGVTPGSEIFLTNDLPSLLKYANREAHNEPAIK